VQTVDFFTPIVDDPYLYGRIAAINSLNDVWAMGGEAITALSVAAFPRDGVPKEILAQILTGGLELLIENDVVLLGGHTIDDKEIKFGYAVTGIVDPARIVRNAGALPGDAIVLTKPLGTGIISTAVKFARAPDDALEASVQAMLLTARTAARLMVEYGAHGGTDVTGFGLLGHAFEVAKASRVRLVIDTAAVPLLPHVIELVEAGNITRGGRTNPEYAGSDVEIRGEIDSRLLHALYDPQTAGGLLVTMAPNDAARYIDALVAAGYASAAIVGHVEEYVAGAHLLLI
jgi:selenide,water dikinase